MSVSLNNPWRWIYIYRYNQIFRPHVHQLFNYNPYIESIKVFTGKVFWIDFLSFFIMTVFYSTIPCLTHCMSVTVKKYRIFVWFTVFLSVLFVSSLIEMLSLHYYSSILSIQHGVPGYIIIRLHIPFGIIVLSTGLIIYQKYGEI